MKLTDLTKKSTSDEDMAWVYELIKEAYDKGESEVMVVSDLLTLEQFTHLRDVKGYTIENNSTINIDTISGW